MFAHTLKLPPSHPELETVYFFDWLQTRVFTPQHQHQAQALFRHAVAQAALLAKLDTTPQTPPYHAEGQSVGDHVRRCLAVVMAMEGDLSLAEIEEVAREKSLLLEFQDLENTLKTQAAFLSVYALCHDLGKLNTVVFEAKPGSPGEAEGFATGLGKLATEPEKMRYDKLRRAHIVRDGETSFYETYNIVVHYPNHASCGAGNEFASTREAVLEFMGVAPAHAKLLTELIRAHMEVIKGFSKGPDPKKYLSLAAVAERAGVNVGVFLDILPAAIFLDAVAGSLFYERGRYQTDFSLLVHLLQSEREAMPERHDNRDLALRRGRKTAVREIMKTAGIDAETVFTLLGTPLGPVRGEVMAKIHDLIRDPERQVNFAEHSHELRRRAQVAHAALRAQHLSIDHL